MPSFKYIARSRTGEKIEGVIEAQDKRMALLQIERMGHVPVSVSEGGLPGGPPAVPGGEKKGFALERRRHGKARMKLHDMLLFTRELSDLLASGMTLGKALHTLSGRKTNKAQDEIVLQLRDEIVQGSSLSSALGKWPETFSTLYVSMVRAGEASGQLAEILERLCKHYERVQEAREKVMMALIYPGIVLSMGTVTLIFSMVFVVPRFSAIFAELGSTLPLPTLILINLSTILIRYGWAIILGIIALVMLIRRALNTKPGRRWWHRMALRVPLIKRIVTANAYAHFARTLGTLLANGVQVLEALSIVEDTVGNVIISEEIREARSRVTDGATISLPLAQGKVFPPLLTDMLAVGEETGDMSGALSHIAKRYDDELDRSVKIFTTVLEPIMIMVMAVLVGFVAISMLLAVFDLTSGPKVQ
ncbi:MAG: type II secretion system F family protein [Verrucomicrobiota bacterium]